MARHRALLIGIESYENLTCVDYARADVIALRERLVEFCSFLPDDIVLMTDECNGENRPTNDRIIAALNRLSNSCEPDDSFLFFFAGHGMHLDNESYLAAINANDHDPVTLKMTSVPLQWVKESIRRIPAHQKVILTDACRNEPARSRSSGANVMERGFRQSFRDIVVSRSPEDLQSVVGLMMACDQGERAYPWREKRHGVFCQHLLEGLSEQSADREGNIVFSRVQEFVQRGMEEWSRQRPDRRQIPYIEVRGHVTIGRLPEAKTKKVRRPTVLIDDEPAAIVVRAEFSGQLFLNGERQGFVSEGRQARIADVEPGHYALWLLGADDRFEWAGELVPGQVLKLLASRKEEAVKQELPRESPDSIKDVPSSGNAPPEKGPSAADTFGSRSSAGTKQKTASEQIPLGGPKVEKNANKPADAPPTVGASKGSTDEERDNQVRRALHLGLRNLAVLVICVISIGTIIFVVRLPRKLPSSPSDQFVHGILKDQERVIATTTNTGRLVGTAKDQSAVPISGAAVTLLNSWNYKDKRTTITDVNGGYKFDELPSSYGYWVIVEAKGFWRSEGNPGNVIDHQTTRFDAVLTPSSRERRSVLMPSVGADTKTKMAAAQQYINGKKYRSAEDIYRQVVKAEPNNVDALKALASVLYREDKIDESAAVLDKVEKLNGAAKDSRDGGKKNY